MFSLSWVKRLCFAMGVFAAGALASGSASAQFYGLGPSFFGPSFFGPGFHGPGIYGPAAYGPGFYGPGTYGFGASGGVSIQSPFFSLNVPPSSNHGYYSHRHPGYSRGYGYTYGPYGYGLSPGISGFHLDIGPSHFGDNYESSRYAHPLPDSYAYRGDVISPLGETDAYAAGRLTMDPVRLSDDLRIAAEQLRQSLVRRADDSDVWLEYLNPDAIINSLLEDDASGAAPLNFAELADHYDGVAGNSELRSISAAPGFARTHALLRHWMQQQNDIENVESATSPAPIPKAKPNPAMENSEPEALEKDIPTPAPDAATNQSGSKNPNRRSL